jgi:phenylpyruvate tautomerase PptA (4-oxalocrotonate tautomerase family)
MIDLVCPAGALSESAKTELMQTLWRSCIRWEALPETPATASIAWVYLDERTPAHISVGGVQPPRPVYRAQVRVIAGFMDQSRIDGLIREVTDAILKADGGGTDSAGPRVFCIVEEVPSGTWGVDGVPWHSAAAAELVGLDPKRVQGIADAIASRPRIDVPA